MPQDFKILVSPDRYQDFLNDPNWLVYSDYIEPVEFNPNNSDMNDFSLGGLTYGYMTSPGGVMQTSQTVSQDVSWWTAPRIGIEVLMDIMTLNSAFTESKSLTAALKGLKDLNADVEAINFLSRDLVHDIEGYYSPKLGIVIERFSWSPAIKYSKDIFKAFKGSNFITTLIEAGLMTNKGEFVTNEALVKIVLKFKDVVALDVADAGFHPITTALKSYLMYTRVST